MLNYRVLEGAEKLRVLKQLSDTYGISTINGSMIISGKEKIRLVNDELRIDDLVLLNNNLRLEFIGLYICKLEKDGVRLSHDAASLFRDDISKNILVVNDSQSEEWLKGHEVLLDDYQSKEFHGKKGFFVLKDNDGMIIGCGKLSNNRITNFVPKSRRLKVRS